MRRQSAAQHAAILEALCARDAALAKSRMREHWLTAMEGSLKDTMQSLQQISAQ